MCVYHSRVIILILADNLRAALSLPPLSSSISSISQSNLTPLTLHLHIVSGWQASSQERRPWGGNGSRVTEWVAEWKAISILCQEGALKAETLPTVAKVCDSISTQIGRKETEIKSLEKEIFICFIFSYVSGRCTKSTLHIQISEQKVSHSETPLEHLNIQYLTHGKFSRDCKYHWCINSQWLYQQPSSRYRPGSLPLSQLAAGTDRGETYVCTGDLSYFKLHIFMFCF